MASQGGLLAGRKMCPCTAGCPAGPTFAVTRSASAQEANVHEHQRPQTTFHGPEPYGINWPSKRWTTGPARPKGPAFSLQLLASNLSTPGKAHPQRLSSGSKSRYLTVGSKSTNEVCSMIVSITAELVFLKQCRVISPYIYRALYGA